MAKKAKNEEFIKVPFMQRNSICKKSISVFEMPENNMDPDAAKRIVQDELNLDGNPTLNLASFVSTRMDTQCEELMRDNLSKNFIDSAEYPQCSVIESRCVAILRKLFHAPEESIREERRVYHPSSPPAKIYGKSTVGSSEAIMLSALNMKWNWEREQPKINGKLSVPCISSNFYDCGKELKDRSTRQPNLVFSDSAHVCWFKFCRYFSVEMHRVPISPTDCSLNIQKALEQCDENTIGIVAVLGNTYTGQFDDVEELDRRLSELNEKKGWKIPIHVDAASGGLIATFLFPALNWDFRLKNVVSINVSGHKYGLVYPGIGWFLIRDFKWLHKGLIFEVDYLGEKELTVTLNFSKASAHIIAQYYQFLRLGKIGYREVFSECIDNARSIENALLKWNDNEGKKYFKIFSHVTSGKPSLPVIAFSGIKMHLGIDLKTFVYKLRSRGWIIPVCKLPLSSETKGVNIARIVLREAHSEMLTNLLIWDIHKAIRNSQKEMNVNVSEMPIDSEEEEQEKDSQVPLLCQLRRVDSIC